MKILNIDTMRDLVASLVAVMDEKAGGLRPHELGVIRVKFEHENEREVTAKAVGYTSISGNSEYHFARSYSEHYKDFQEQIGILVERGHYLVGFCVSDSESVGQDFMLPFLRWIHGEHENALVGIAGMEEVGEGKPMTCLVADRFGNPPMNQQETTQLDPALSNYALKKFIQGRASE